MPARVDWSDVQLMARPLLRSIGCRHQPRRVGHFLSFAPSFRKFRGLYFALFPGNFAEISRVLRHGYSTWLPCRGPRVCVPPRALCLGSRRPRPSLYLCQAPMVAQHEGALQHVSKAACLLGPEHALHERENSLDAGRARRMVFVFHSHLTTPHGRGRRRSPEISRISRFRPLSGNFV